MKKQNHIWVPVAAALVCIALLYILDLVLPSGHMLFTVLKKSAIYALVAVSMNLLNGFTGLFSLGQAGFMLIGAYAYAIFTIPVEAKEKVYQYYDCIIGFSLPIPVALVLAGLLAAVFAWLFGLPVLRLKSDTWPLPPSVLPRSLRPCSCGSPWVRSPMGPTCSRVFPPSAP